MASVGPQCKSRAPGQDFFSKRKCGFTDINSFSFFPKYYFKGKSKTHSIPDGLISKNFISATTFSRQRSTNRTIIQYFSRMPFTHCKCVFPTVPCVFQLTGKKEQATKKHVLNEQVNFLIPDTQYFYRYRHYFKLLQNLDIER